MQVPMIFVGIKKNYKKKQKKITKFIYLIFAFIEY